MWWRVCRPLSPDYSPQPPMKRFLLDNDGSNIFHNSPWEGAALEELVDETVRECADEVSTVLICSNAGNCNFPTRVGLLDPRASMLHEAREEGKDLFGMLLRAFKESGRETFVTMRMNDVHNPDDSDGWNTPPVRRDNPDLVVGMDEIKAGTAQWMSYCLDYSRPEVQEYNLALIGEMAELYGDTIDGLQLDWMRFPRHLSGQGDEVWEKREHLTTFTAEARKILKSASTNILLAARVPPTTEGCRMLGMELPEWTAQGLVDFLVLCPFLTTNWTIPVEEFRDWIGRNDVPLYAGFDFGYGKCTHHPESLRAVCTSLYGCGADGIYVFNFPCWTEYIAARPYHWLAGLECPESAATKPLQFSVNHARHRQPCDGVAQLPVTLSPDGSVSLNLMLPQSTLPAWRCLLLANSHGDVKVAVNGEPASSLQFSAGEEGHRSEIFLEFADQYFQKDARPKPSDCRIFKPKASMLQAGENVIQIANTGRQSITVESVKLGLW